MLEFLNQKSSQKILEKLKGNRNQCIYCANIITSPMDDSYDHMTCVFMHHINKPQLECNRDAMALSILVSVSKSCQFLYF